MHLRSFFFVILAAYSSFLHYIELRPGTSLMDPILHCFSPHDMTWLTFFLIYVSLTIGIIALYRHHTLFAFLHAYSLLIIIRMMAMYLLPLNPPPGMIPLHDPVVAFFGRQTILTKDLFFSGHTATIFLLYLSTTNKLLRMSFMFASACIAICLLLQHVHYTEDLFAALFFAYGSYRLNIALQRWRPLTRGPRDGDNPHAG